MKGPHGERRQDQAIRHAREIVDDMRWRGMAVPPVYASMADEFSALVRSGQYAAWLAGPARSGGHQTRA